MLTIGLTGNVAAGKSAVAAMLEARGATVLDADRIVRTLQTPGEPVYQAIVARFGPTVVSTDGSLDRDALRRQMLCDPRAREALNAIVHPAVADRQAVRIEEVRARGDCVVVQDIPLLFEVLDPRDFDLVILVDAPEAVRRERLVRDRGLDPREADRLIRTQMPAADKRARADLILENTGTLGDLEQQVAQHWPGLRRRAALSFPPAGRIVAVLAHPDDEAYALGGTLARYADAGSPCHLICLTDGAAGTRSAETPAALGRRRRADLGSAARILRLASHRVLDFVDGGLVPDDPAGPEAVAAALEELSPDLVLTFGPDGLTGHPDHRATSRWTAIAHRRLATRTRSRLAYITCDGDAMAGFPESLHTRPLGEIAVRLDIRPWADTKQRAIEAHGTQAPPFALNDPAVRPLFTAEWFATDPPAGPPVGAFPPPVKAA